MQPIKIKRDLTERRVCLNPEFLKYQLAMKICQITVKY